MDVEVATLNIGQYTTIGMGIKCTMSLGLLIKQVVYPSYVMIK
jgi:hypothetical protein